MSHMHIHIYVPYISKYMFHMCITEHHEALLPEGAAKCAKGEDDVIVYEVLKGPLDPDEVVRVRVGREFFEPLVEEGAPGGKIEKKN